MAAHTYTHTPHQPLTVLTTTHAHGVRRSRNSTTHAAHARARPSTQQNRSRAANAPEHTSLSGAHPSPPPFSFLPATFLHPPNQPTPPQQQNQQAAPSLPRDSTIYIAGFFIYAPPLHCALRCRTRSFSPFLSPPPRAAAAAGLPPARAPPPLWAKVRVPREF